jgi:hypothetical protein
MWLIQAELKERERERKRMMMMMMPAFLSSPSLLL